MTQQDIENWLGKAYRDTLIGYELMNAADVFFRRAHKYSALATKGLYQEKKRRAGEMTRHIEAAIKLFDMKSISVDSIYLNQIGPEVYDKIRHNSNEIARLIMLYHEKCINPKAAQMVNKYLENLSGEKIFDLEEYQDMMKV